MPPSSAFSGIDGRAVSSSMQKSRPAFYPDIVAQVYPWLADVRRAGTGIRDGRGTWRQHLARAGSSGARTNPWGLVALAAEKLGDTSRRRAGNFANPIRAGGSSWNVLEEAAWPVA